MICKIDKHDNPYVMIDKAGIDDKRLSFRAKGLLVYLISKPKDWKVIMGDLINNSPSEGRDAIRSTMKELETFGYAEIMNTRDENTGQLNGSYWKISETSQPKSIEPKEEFSDLEENGTTADSPDTAEPRVGLPGCRQNRMSAEPRVGLPGCRQNRMSAEPAVGKTSTTKKGLITKEGKKNNKGIETKEKSNKKENDFVSALQALSIPKILDTEEFKIAWKDWVEYQTGAKKKPLNALGTLKLQLKKLENFGHDGALLAIETAINKGWHGIFKIEPYQKLSLAGGRTDPAAMSSPIKPEDRVATVIRKPNGETYRAAPPAAAQAPEIEVEAECPF